MKTESEQTIERAKEFHQAGQLTEALQLYREVYETGDYYPHAWYLYGVLLNQLGRYMDAIPVLEEAAKKGPQHEPTLCSLGHALFWVNRLDDARKVFIKVLRIDGKNLDATIALSKLFVKQQQWDDLVFLCYQGYGMHPDNTEVIGYLIHGLSQKDRHVEAAELLVKHMLVNGDESDTCYKWLEGLFAKVTTPSITFRGRLSQLSKIKGKHLYIRASIRAKDPVAAEAAFKTQHDQYPEHTDEVELMTNAFFADALQNEKLFREAEPYHWRALSENPNDFRRVLRLAETILGRAKEDIAEKYVEAKDLGEYLLNKHPDDPGVLELMANIYMGASRPEPALKFYDAIFAQNPRHHFFGTSYLFNLNYDETRSPEEIFAQHEKWGKAVEQEKKHLRKSRPKEGLDKDKKLRIGYVSPDFGNHPVGYFMINIIKSFDSENFDLYLYVNRDEQTGNDPLSREFKKLVGEKRWYWTRTWPDNRLISKIQEDKIDILVDLTGHTAYNRLTVFIKRPAPIQVNWLGYPNTTGLRSIDYRFSDAITEPPGESDERSTETIYRLPNGFHCFSLPKNLPDVNPEPPCSRNGYITFGTYNNMNKLGHQSIALWAELLKAIPTARIVIKHKTLAVLDNRESLRSQFAMHGIQARRVELLETTPGQKQHLDTYNDIDVALDPLAYNGTTTSCDALLMGVPVLTLPGRAHAARVTSSLLHRVGLDGWVAFDEKDFIKRGIQATRNPGLLSEIRKSLRERFINSPLGSGEILTRDIEAAYRDMWVRYCEAPIQKKTQTYEELPWKL